MIKKKIFNIFILFILIASFLSFNVHAANDDSQVVSFGTDIDVVSRSFWRGQYWTGGVTWMPSIWAESNGLYSSFWARMPLDDVTNEGEFNLVTNDTYYRFEVDGLGMKAGFITYFYVNTPGWSTTGEAYAGLDYTVGQFTLATNHYFDVMDFLEAYYGDFSLTFNQPIADSFVFSSQLNTGWGNGTFNNPYSGYNSFASRYVGLDISLRTQLNEYFYVKPYFHYNLITDSSIKNAVGDTNVIAVGVMVGFSR